MGDRTRLFLTGVAAAGAIAVTVAAPAPWTWFDGDDTSYAAPPLASLRNFDGVLLQGPDTVIVTQGPAFSVATEGDPEAQKHLTMSVHDGTLRIGRRAIHGWWGGRPATIRVTMPGLARVWITGSGDIQAARIDGKEFAARLDGSGGLKIADVEAGAVRLSINGSGNMDLGGNAREVSATLVGSGTLKGDNLKAQTADVSVTGSGQVHARAAQTAKLVLSGSGHAQVDGTNRCQIQRTGSGDAACTS